MALIKVHEY